MTCSFYILSPVSTTAVNINCMPRLEQELQNNCHASSIIYSVARVSGRNSLSEISLPVRCKPLELALLVPVNVSLPPLLFCLI